MKYKNIIKIAGLAGAVLLCGCGSSSDDSSSTSESAGTESSSTDDSSAAELATFNLSDISASSSDVKSMTLTWDAASPDSGVTYSVCEKDTSQDNNCNVLTIP